MEEAPYIVTKLWDNVSLEEAVKIVKEHFAWDSCIDGMMVIHPTLSYEEALVLVVYYENPTGKKPTDLELKEIFIRSEVKKTCVLHTTLQFEELLILAKYKYLKNQ